MDFAAFLENSHSESNWFLAALRAAQPYICDTPNASIKKPPSQQKRSELWQLARAAADDLAGVGLKKAVEPVCAALISIVPFLSLAPAAFTFGFSIVLVHYAKKGFCTLKIQQEIITTLKWKSADWESK